MKIIKIICSIALALTLEAVAAKETRWVPSGNEWKDAEADGHIPTTVFETDMIFVQVYPGYTGLFGLLEFRIVIRNKTIRDGTFYYSKTYLKDNDSFTAEVFTKDQAHERLERAVIDSSSRSYNPTIIDIWNRTLAENLEKSTFRSVEPLQPTSQKSGSLYFERSWLEDRKTASAFQLYIGSIEIGAQATGVPALIVTRTRFDIDKKGNFKIIK